MAAQDNETKKRISRVALALFSVRGFHAVSIRDIGRQAGVKESTIYYYFKSKDDIFQSLLVSIRTIMQDRKSLFQSTLDQARRIDKDPFISIAVNFMENFLLHDDIYPFIQMLLIERHANTSADQLFRELIFSAPEEQYKAIFTLMAQRGFFHAVDPTLLAFEYHSIVTYVFFKYFGGGKASNADHEKARRDLINLVGSFYSRYLQRI
jgi:AcrR family transcriptional regulator